MVAIIDIFIQNHHKGTPEKLRKLSSNFYNHRY